MAKSLVTCLNCGKEFLKENAQIKIKKNHFCCYECHNLFIIRENLNKSIGIKYGQLTVLSLSFRKDKCSYVNCLCDCGNYCVRKLCSLKCKKVKTCGNCLSDKERFMLYVKIVNKSLWLWIGCRSRYGYGQFAYKGKPSLAHRVAYELFIGEIPKGMCCCHKDDNPQNVSPWNLFLGSRGDNNFDKVKKGRGFSPKGETNKQSKLTEKEVLEIRDLCQTGDYSYNQLGLMFGVNGSNIGKIASKKAWTHI